MTLMLLIVQYFNGWNYNEYPLLFFFVLGSDKNSTMTSMPLGCECEHNEMMELEGKKSREWVQCKSPCHKESSRLGPQPHQIIVQVLKISAIARR